MIKYDLLSRNQIVMMIKASQAGKHQRMAGEGAVTLQTLPWVLISPTIAPDGKHLLVPLAESDLCLSALLPKSATRGSLRGRGSIRRRVNLRLACPAISGPFSEIPYLAAHPLAFN